MQVVNQKRWTVGGEFGQIMYVSKLLFSTFCELLVVVAREQLRPQEELSSISMMADPGFLCHETEPM